MTEGDEPDLSDNTRDMTLMVLGTIDIIFLFVTYAAILLYSICNLYWVLSGVWREDLDSEIYAMRVLFLSALSGSSIFYTRKLYKAGINGAYSFEVKGISIARVSTIAYFMFRIPFSLIFSIVVYASWRLSVDFATSGDFVYGEKSKYVFILIGFFSGFSSGRFLEHFEKNGMRLSGYSSVRK